MSIEDTRDRLAKYGDWSRADKSIGYPSASATAIRRSGDPKMSDDEAMLIDRCLCSLRREHQDEWTMIVMYYCHCLAMPVISKRLGVSQTKARKMIERGEYWVDAALSFGFDHEKTA